MKIFNFLLQKRRHMAVAATLVSASVVIGCTRNTGTFSNLWGPDGFTFKDAGGKAPALVGKDKDQTAPDPAAAGPSRTVGMIEPGKKRPGSTGSARTGSSLMSSADTGKARVSADNLSNPFIAPQRQNLGRVIAASSDVSAQQRDQIVTADAPSWAEETGTSRVGSKADNFVPQRPSGQGQFSETFNSQMDRLRSEMKAEAGRNDDRAGDRRADFSRQASDVPKFDETVAPNEAIEVVEPLKAPEIAPSKPAAMAGQTSTAESRAGRASVVDAQPAVLPVITPRKRPDRPAQGSKAKVQVAPAEAVVGAAKDPKPAVAMTDPMLSTTWDPAPQQPVVGIHTPPAKSAEPTLAIEPLRPERLDAEELVVATRNLSTREELRRGSTEPGQSAANTPFSLPVPALSPSEFDAPNTPEIPVPQRSRVDTPVPSMKAAGQTPYAPALDPKPLPSSTMVAQAVPATRVPGFGNRVTPSDSISANRGGSFLNKVPKAPIASTTALEAVHFDADLEDTQEATPAHGFPKWPVPVGIVVASLFFVFARRRLRAEN